MRIGHIVRQRLPVTVMSYDPHSGRIEPRRVVNWFDNGRTNEFIKFEVRGGPARRRCFAVTANHLVFTPNGEVPAGRLKEGDQVLFALPDYALTDDQYQLLIGSGLGDGSFRMVGRHSAHFRVAHAPRQKDYLTWKHAMLQPFSRPIGPVGNGIGFSVLTMPALAELRNGLYDAEGCRIVTSTILERLDARGLAAWYGDDGAFEGSYARWGNGKAGICNTSLQGESRRAVVAALRRLGFEGVRDTGGGFWLNSRETARFQEMIAPYLHPAVDHKLHPSLRGRFTWHPETSEADSLKARRRFRPMPVEITRRSTKSLGGHTHRFDLEIEGHHTYLADGVVVHNSPETTTGGRALKFYASVRLDIRRQDAIKQGTESIGVRTKVKVVKNKLAPPFREAEFDVLYGEGISKAGTVLDAAVEQSLVEKSGTWYTFKSERIGHGRENAKKWLLENPAALADLEAKVREALGLRPAASLK
jgi:recombination protein RecA